MALVIDASIALPWFLHDERSAFTDGILSELGQAEIWVPPLWRLELANGLLMAERRKRIDRQTRLEALELAEGMAIRVDSAPVQLREISSLAERHGLTAYDASYLELAVRQGFALATLDRTLAHAAAAEGVPVHSPGRGSAAEPRRRYRREAAA
ncbi:MAG: type II toxin-antitoxin system VapC family toxin [Betaproteobacteria bacterium]|nr:type II toxin-antitoxin system VapC family toxin [Betaproteobacteria bacterium]